MNAIFTPCSLVLTLFAILVGRGEPPAVLAGERRLNNLVSDLLEVGSISKPDSTFTFTRENEGWIFISAAFHGGGSARIWLDNKLKDEAVFLNGAGGAKLAEAMRYVEKGEHQIRVTREGGEIAIDKLVVKAVSELMHCGLGFNPQIKSYGLYDMKFLEKDILPNVTTLVVPNNIKLTPAEIDAWHAQGKKFVAEVGVNGQLKTAEEHAAYWTGFFEKAPFLDGIIINEFIVNAPATVPFAALPPDRQTRMKQEQARYVTYGEAIKKVRADARFEHKLVYAYVGGSGKTLNQEVIGPNFIRTIIDCHYRVALERYLHEMSSPQGSADALEKFKNGIADWEAKQPGVKNHMVIAFGLFSMPPGGINKQPNVDYHVWMDQQMNLVANDQILSGIAGLEWWTSVLADEETVRFVGKLYRHYAIEGQTKMLTKDPLFLTHIKNADFEHGVADWTLQEAEAGSIQPRSFPRYGRIEGRFMGLGRPADPEHIGDTFLWMKRSPKGPNTFSQTIKDLQPGRLYSMKMFSCDYQDLLSAKAKKQEDANKFIGDVTLEGVDLDKKRSFTEIYPSGPEPANKPIWITYHWKVFRARGPTARITVSDWPADRLAAQPFGQEQTFNFVEIQPYHE